MLCLSTLCNASAVSQHPTSLLATHFPASFPMTPQEQIKFFHSNVKQLRAAVSALRDDIRLKGELTPQRIVTRRSLTLKARVWQASVLLTSTYLPAVHKPPHRDILRLCKNLRL